MPVKYWSFAGLMITYWCNARCASCYLSCSPDRRGEDMSVERALSYWEGLIAASPHGCRIHLTGGEPFGDWPRLIEICRLARAAGLAPLEKVETNAFWATDAAVVRDRVAALDAAGMGKLSISADPYHQQFVPIQRCRLAASVAEEMLGRDRVQVRWRDWLADGLDTDSLSEARRAAAFDRYAAGRRDRMSGRAADILARRVCDLKSWQEFADIDCRQAVLRSRHVHVDPSGLVMPGTCAGLVLGQASGGGEIAEIWRRLADGPGARPVAALLAAGGPAGLTRRAVKDGFAPQAGYASKCHLCWDVRRWLTERGMYKAELAPAWMYGL